MKNVLFIFALVVIAASCGSNSTSTSGTDSACTDSTCSDSISIDSLAHRVECRLDTALTEVKELNK
jgi:hypothetical protein